MKNYIGILILLICVSTSLSAQNLFNQAKQAAFEESSDPKAKAILDKLKEKYDTYANMEVSFTLTIEGESEEVSHGVVFLEGEEKYRLEMDEQDIICNGKTIWFHIKGENEEVQINNPDPEAEDNLNPSQLMKVYEQDMVYAHIGENTENKKAVDLIEFKPKDRDAEFFKYRVSIDKTANEITKVIAFSRDASRYIIEFGQIKANQTWGEDIFQFDLKKHPNIHVEDLRVE